MNFYVDTREWLNKRTIVHALCRNAWVTSTLFRCFFPAFCLLAYLQWYNNYIKQCKQYKNRARSLYHFLSLLFCIALKSKTLPRYKLWFSVWLSICVVQIVQDFTIIITMQLVFAYINSLSCVAYSLTLHLSE